MNPKQKIEELFQTIESSKEYKSYQNIKSIIEKNKEINSLTNNIKKLQQKAVKLEHQNNSSSKEIDKEIQEKIKKLNSIPIYQEYTRRMNELNDILAESSNQIEKYINSKI